MSLAYSEYFSEPHGPEHARRHDVGKAEDGVERRAQLVGDVGHELGLGAVAELGLLGRLLVHVGELVEVLGVGFELQLRLLRVGDHRQQAALGLEQLLLVALDLGDVGLHRNDAAVLGAALVDLKPQAVVELDLLRRGAGLRLAHGVDLARRERLSARREHVLAARPAHQHVVIDRVELPELRVPQDQPLARVPQDEGLRDGFDGVAQPRVGAFRLAFQRLLLRHVDRDADEVRVVVAVEDELRAQPHARPAPVVAAHAEAAVDRLAVSGQRVVAEMDEVEVFRVHHARDLGRGELVVAPRLPQDLAHGRRPLHRAAREVPVPHAAAPAKQRGVEPGVVLLLRGFHAARACALAGIGEQDDEE